MPNFIRLDSYNVPASFSNWKDAKKFISRNRIVHENGQAYELFAKKEKKLSFTFLRKCIGLILVGSTLGVALASKKVRRLFANSTSVRFGAPLQAEVRDLQANQPAHSFPLRQDYGIGLPTGREASDSRPQTRTLPDLGVTEAGRNPLEREADNSDPDALRRLSDIGLLFRNRETDGAGRGAVPLPDSSNPAGLPQNANFSKLAHLELDHDHPLMQPISLETYRGDVVRGFLPMTEEDVARSFSALLNISLQHWLEAPLALENNRRRREFPGIVAALEQRIEQLNGSVQLQDRLRILGGGNLTLRDLLAPWSSSKLRYELAMNDELPEIALESISCLPTSSFLNRIHALDNPADAASIPERPEGIRLLELINLPVDQVNEWAPRLPAAAFCFVQIADGLDMEQLSDEQVSMLFQMPNQLTRLTTAQISTCVQRNLARDQWKNLSEAQIQRLDFAGLNMNQEMFNSLFPAASNKIALIDSNQMRHLYEFFRTEDWKALTEEQIRQIDFSELHLDRLDFKTIFDDARENAIASKIQCLSADQRLHLYQHFELRHWRVLTEGQVAEIDFSQVPINRDLFRAIFGDDREGVIASKIHCLSADQRLHLYQHFEITHWKALTEGQVAEIDFSQVVMDRRLFKTIFEDVYGTVVASKIHCLSADQRLHLYQHFEINHWRALTEGQVAEIDFSQVVIDRRQFKAIFVDFDGTLVASKFACLGAAQRASLYRHFEINHWRALTEGQVAEIDFSQVVIDRLQFRAIFEDVYQTVIASKIRCLSAAQRALLYGHFERKHWQALTEGQIADIDFAPLSVNSYILGQTTKQIFDNDSDEPIPSKIRRLQPDQIYVLKGALLGRHWRELSVEQITQLDFSRLAMERTKFRDIFWNPFGFLVAEKIRCLNADQIQHLHGYFSQECWQALTYGQKQQVQDLLPAEFR